MLWECRFPVEYHDDANQEHCSRAKETGDLALPMVFRRRQSEFKPAPAGKNHRQQSHGGVGRLNQEFAFQLKLRMGMGQ